MPVIEYIYDFGSPNAYLVNKVLPDLAARCGAELIYSPALLGGIFKAIGNQSPMEAFAHLPTKSAYQKHQMERFIRQNAIPFQRNPHFPVNTISLMRGAAYATGKPWEKDYREAVFDSMWLNAKLMSDPEVFGSVLSEAGLPADDILTAIQTPEVKADLMERTSAAIERGVFGIPTMLVGDEMFFGKDSLHELEVHLKG